MQKAPLGTCHGDCHLDNFMFCKDSNKLSVIDFEVTRPFPVAYDLANHFSTYASLLVVSF